MTTIIELVAAVQVAAFKVGIDVKRQEVAFIISLFLEGMVHGKPTNAGVDEWLQRIADEVSKVK